MSTQDYLYTASYFFERERGRSMDAFERSSIVAAGLDQADPGELRQEIQDLLASGSLQAEERTTAYFALGKTLDVSFKRLFQRHLELELATKSCAVYQLLICLSDLGELVFGKDRDGSFSAFDVDLNLRDAQDYLAKVG